MTLLEYPYISPEAGGFQGFLCAVFETYSLKLRDPGFRCAGGPVKGPLSAASPSPGLFDEAVSVPFSADRAERAGEGIRQRGGPETWTAILRAFLSDMEDREETVFRFIRILMDGGGPGTIDRLDIPAAVRVRRGAYRTANEAHKFLGILRFGKHGNLYYAPIQPGCRVLPLIAKHFRTRFRDQDWVIHDIGRSEALFWDRETLTFETGVSVEKGRFRDEDDFYEGLWKTYFSAAAIAERKNLELQRKFVPLKYRSNMTEMSGGHGAGG